MLPITKRHYSHWLIPYLEGELDPKRMALLESRLARDADLADDLERLRSHLGLIRSAASTAPYRDPEFSILPKVQAELRARPGQNFWGVSLTLAASSVAAICIAVAVAHSVQAPEQDTAKPTLVASSHSPQLETFGVPPAMAQIGNGVGSAIKNKFYNMDGLVNAGDPRMTYRRVVSKTPVASPSASKSHTGKSHRNHGRVGAPNNDPFDAGPRIYAYNTGESDSHASAGNWSHMTAKRDRRHNSDDGVAGPATYDADRLREQVYDHNASSAWSGAFDQPVATAGASGGSHTRTMNHGAEVRSNSPDGTFPVVSHDYAGQPGNPTDSSGVVNVFPQHKLTKLNPGGAALGALPSDEQNINDWSAKALALANQGQAHQAMDTWRDALMLQLQSPNYNDEAGSEAAAAILSSIKATGNLSTFRTMVKQQVNRQYLPTIGELPDWRILGQIDSMQGLYAEAQNAWQHVIDTGAANGEDWYQLAVVRQKLGNEAGARAAYQKAVAALPFLSEHQARAQQYLAKSH